MIESTIQHISSNFPQSSGDNLLGFRIDTDAALNREKLLHSYELQLRDDPLSMINVTANLAKIVENLADVSRILRDVWSDLAYDHFEASAILRYRDATILRFITVISDESFFVSGTIRVIGDQYPKLAANYEQDWKRVLASAPEQYVV